MQSSKSVPLSLMRFALIVSIVSLFGCNDYFLLSKSELRSKTFEYITDSYGSYTRYVFDSSGTSGAYETGTNTFGYASEAAAQTGTYEAKSYYLIDGSRGSFSYDPDLYTIDLNVSERFLDSRWLSLLEIARSTISTSVSAYSQNIHSCFVPNSDVPGFGDGVFILSDGAYRNTYTSTTSVTIAGSTSINTTHQERSLILTSDSIQLDQQNQSTEKTGGETSILSTETRSSTYSIKDFFLVGRATGTLDFNDVWKNGNTVSFATERTQEEVITYTGPTPPSTAPIPSVYTGKAESSGDGWDWSINLLPCAQETMTYKKFDRFIINSAMLLHAGRDL